MAISALQIGIETEVFLCAIRMKDQCKPCHEDFARSLVEYYNSKVRNRARRSRTEIRYSFDAWHASDEDNNWRYWSIVEDGSMSLENSRYLHMKTPSMRPCEDSRLLRPPVLMRVVQGGFEFTSPILRYEYESLWRVNLRSHFHILETYAEIISHVSCGTHVHVSLGGSPWTLDQVRNVSRSILYFEEAFEVLLPPDRRGNRHCRSNRIDNPKLRHLPDLETCCERIHECTTIEALTDLMNAMEITHGNNYEYENGEPCLTERSYAFNFENLRKKIGTIGMHDEMGSPSLLEAHAHHLQNSDDLPA